LLLGGVVIVGWALWKGTRGNWRWLAAAPLIAFTFLAGCYWLLLLSYAKERPYGLEVTLWHYAFGRPLDAFVDVAPPERYTLFTLIVLLQIIGLHTAPLAALVWGWMAWAGWTRTRDSQPVVK
jgi:hypothetical protein